MKKQFFNELSNAAAATQQQVTNKQALNKTTSGVRRDMRERSYMYFVNEFNRLAKKNEYMENINMRDLQNMFKIASGEKEFTLHMFSPDYQNRPCYITKYKGNVTTQDLLHGDIITDDKGNELRVSSADSEQIVTYHAISKTESSFLTAYRSVLAPFAAEQDKAIREQEKAQRKAERSAESNARKAARKALKEQQQQARIDYNNGKMSLADFAAIMSKVA